MQSALDELDALQARSGPEFRRAFAAATRAIAKAELGKKKAGRLQASAKLAEAIGDSLILADLLGRRRILIEADAAEKTTSEEDQARAVFQAPDFFEAPPVPSVPLTEAVEDLVRRRPQLATTAAEVAKAYRTTKAFALAKSTELAITKRIQKEIAKFSRRGAEFPTVTKVLQQTVEFSRAYAETVYRTNLNTAYTAGRFQQAKDPDVAKVVGAFERLSANDTDVRKNHAAAHGLIAAVTDPVWDVASTPSGYNCRCMMRLVGKGELKRRGLLDADGNVIRREPARFSEYFPDPGFGGSRPDAAFYGA